MSKAPRRRVEEWVASPILWKLQLGFAAFFLLIVVLELVVSDDRSLWSTLSRLGFVVMFLVFARLSYQHRRR